MSIGCIEKNIGNTCNIYRFFMGEVTSTSMSENAKRQFFLFIAPFIRLKKSIENCCGDQSLSVSEMERVFWIVFLS